MATDPTWRDGKYAPPPPPEPLVTHDYTYDHNYTCPDGHPFPDTVPVVCGQALPASERGCEAIVVCEPSARGVALRAELERLRAALALIAESTPKVNLARERVNVPVLDAWEAQRIAAGALVNSCT